MDKKGFTLIELLATIVILGLLMAIAIPNVINVVNKNRASSYTNDAKKLQALAVEKLKSDTTIVRPNEANDCTIMTLNYLGKTDFSEAPHGGKYNTTKSFVVVKVKNINIASQLGVTYDYYVSLVEDLPSSTTENIQEQGISLIPIDSLTTTKNSLSLIKKKDFVEPTVLKSASTSGLTCGEQTYVYENKVPVEQNYTISTVALPNAAGVTSGGGTFKKGTDVTVTATLNTGYKFVKWLDNGTEVSNNLTYTIYSIHSNHHLTAVYARELVNGNIYNFLASANTSYALDIYGASINDSGNLQLWEYNNSNAQQFIAVDNGDNTWSFVAYCSGMYLDLSGAQVEKGQNIQQYSYNNSSAQKWYIKYNDEKTITFQSNVDHSFAFDITNGTIANKSNIQLWKSNGSDAQKFVVKKVGTVPYLSASYTIQSAFAPDKNLDVDARNSANKTNIQLYTQNNSPAQTFTLMYGRNSTYRILTFCGKAVDVENGLTVPGTNIQEYDVNYSASQNWYIESNADGTVSFKSQINNLYMDVAGGVDKNRTNVQCWTGNGTKAQQWRLNAK